MVNTRRSETIGTTSELTTLHCPRDSSVETSTVSEKQQSGEDSSWNSNQQTQRNSNKGENSIEKVRELRSRFVHNQRRYSANLRSGTKRHSLNVYTVRKMHDNYNEDDSESEMYSRNSRKSRHLHNRQMERVERRTALSLRPISQKCYADSHSDLDADLRRSQRQRKVKVENMSWLADDQMHKIGYPNLNETGYSEEDSRDATDLNVTRRITRHSQNSNIKRREIKNPKYLYDYETQDVGRTRRRSENNRTHHESNDKENNEANNITNEEDSVDIDEISLNLRANGESYQKPLANEPGNDVNLKETKTEEKPDEILKQDDSSDDFIGIRKTRRTRNKIDLNNRYSRRTLKTRPRYVSSSSESDRPKKSYLLRTRPPKVAPIKTVLRNYEHQSRPRKRFQRRRQTASSSSSSSSSERVKKQQKLNKNEQKMKSGADGSKITPIVPETLDSNIRFSSIGGLDSHIQCLKEMIVLPMMYPEVFKQFQIQPPRGVLFYGPPGTGKTLIARALANECTRFSNTKKVSFFMRKGADLLSKWIGESEKQLRLLFEQAAEMAPSIIFFDELDGLAPVRSSRQDQVHASIVSTLLALMDGLDSRGEIIVIGATNRIDAIDPALRRPGRFDRELFFSLPAKQEREAIIKVHVSQWTSKPTDDLVSYLAETSVGYCGSDLRALCSEGVIQAFRRTYPQVYSADYRLMLNAEQVKVEKIDFLRAKSLLVPASQRICQGLGRKLMPIVEPLLVDALNMVFKMIKDTFPHGLNPALSKVKITPNIRPAQLLVFGENANYGQTNHLAPAVLYKMEHLNSYTLDLNAMYRESGRTAEEACIQIFNEARRNIPSVIYIPNIDAWWRLMSETVKSILESQLIQLDPNIPILLLATADSIYDNLPEEIQSLFSKYRNEVLCLEAPSVNKRQDFFKPLIIDACLKPAKDERKRTKLPSPLPKARTPSPTPLTEEQSKKLYEQEEHTLRELRIFLRDICKKLANNKLFYMFTKPVDTEEVPDYTEIIKQPMDLETMMTKVDFHRYACAKDFLNDIELICRNALEYNPAKSSADKQIRHRACSLYDYAYTLIKNEMDTDFEDKCQEIAKQRCNRKASVQKYLPAYIQTPGNILLNEEAKKEKEKLAQEADLSKPPELKIETPKSDSKPTDKGSVKKRKMSSWQRGCLKKRKKINHNKSFETKQGSSENETDGNKDELEPPVLTNIKDQMPDQVPLDRSQPLTINCSEINHSNENDSIASPSRKFFDLMSPSELLENQMDFDDIDQALNEIEGKSRKTKPVECSEDHLNKVLTYCVEITNGLALQSLLDLYNQLDAIVKKYSKSHLRTNLPKELLAEIIRFKKECGLEDFTDNSPSCIES